MKKIITQTIICLMLFGLFTVTGNISEGNISDYSNKVKAYIMKDYELSKIKDNAVAAASFAVEKPKEMYLAIVDSDETRGFTVPIDEVAVSVFSNNNDSDEYKYMSDETIVVHCSNSGMVEKIESNEESGSYTVTVKHDDGISSKYIGCTKLYVKESERVKRSQIIGEVENEGIRNFTFEIWKSGKKEDPKDYIM